MVNNGRWVMMKDAEAGSEAVVRQVMKLISACRRIVDAEGYATTWSL